MLAKIARHMKIIGSRENVDDGNRYRNNLDIGVTIYRL